MADPNSSNTAEQLNSPPVSLLELAEDAPENPHAALRGFFAAQILFILPRKRGHEGRDPERRREAMQRRTFLRGSAAFLITLGFASSADRRPQPGQKSQRED